MSTDSGAVAPLPPLDQITPDQFAKPMAWITGDNVKLAAIGLTYAGCAPMPTYGRNVLKDGTTECTCADYQRKIAARDGRDWQPCAHGGKVPHHRAWQTLGPRDPNRVKSWFERETGGYPHANVSIATGEEHGVLCLDVDGELGRKHWAELVEAHGGNPDTPTQETGGGGLQMFFAWPKGRDIRNTASRLTRKDGSTIDHIDVRGNGGQAVVAPSMHRSGNRYRWVSGLAMGQVPLAEAPDWLIDMMFSATKGRRTEGAGGVAAVKLKSNTPVSPGGSKPAVNGRQEYLALIGDAEGQGGFDGPIYRSLCSYFATHGPDASLETIKELVLAAVRHAHKDPAKDRGRYETEEYLDEQVAKAKIFVASSKTSKPDKYLGATCDTHFGDEAELIEAMKEKCSVLMLPSAVRMILHTPHGYHIVPERDAKVALADHQLVSEGRGGKLIYIPGMTVYCRSPERTVYHGLTCDPTGQAGGTAFNTWRGLNRQARRGSWALMRKHLLDIICAGDEEHFTWLLAWLAQMFVEPAYKRGTALVIVGPKGAGKSTLGRWLHAIIGDVHCKKVSQPRHLVGNFNAHLRDALLLQVEEAMWGGSKEAEGVIKDLITAELIRIEQKGVDSVECPSFVRIMIMANPGWLIPATKGERRYMVLTTLEPFGELPQAEGDIARAAYFQALEDEFEAGGPEAMLHDLLEFNFSGVNLRKPPVTAGLADQIALTMSSEEEWLLSSLHLGAFVDREGDVLKAWPQSGDLLIETKALMASYSAHVKTWNGSGAGVQRVVRFLGEHGEVTKTRLPAACKGAAREWGYKLGSLDDWRKRFADGHKVTFDEPVEEVANSATVSDLAEERLRRARRSTDTRWEGRLDAGLLAIWRRSPFAKPLDHSCCRFAPSHVVGAGRAPGPPGRPLRAPRR